MWMVNNQTPFAAACNWNLDKNAAKIWVVAVKATFDILPDGSTRIAAAAGKTALTGKSTPAKRVRRVSSTTAISVEPKQRTELC